jgi:hypothetical protein
MRIFAAFQHFNWEEHNLTPGLQAIGDVVRYDWHPPYDQYSPGWHYGLKQAMNQEMLERLCAAHEQAPIDVFYGYLCGRLVFRGYVEAIRRLGIPSLTMCLDDKTHRHSALEPTGWAGMVDVASAFDLCWTSDPTAVAWYESIGARAIYQPAGANPDLFVPVERERDIDVLFVGKRYGRRESVLWHLQENGIHVQAYGQGWDQQNVVKHAHGPVSTPTMVELMNRATITLGLGETGDPALLSLKGRDFEAPMCGAFYLVQHNPELLEHYTAGEHLDTWADLGELARKCRYYLAHREDAERIRRQAAAHSRQHHTWEQRFRRAFAAMGVLS